MSIKKMRTTKCDKCQKVFYRKLVAGHQKGSQRQLTKLNEVSYWTNGVQWNNYQILCRVCLNDWFEKYRLDFADLVKGKRRKTYYHYRYLGLFAKSKELYQ